MAYTPIRLLVAYDPAGGSCGRVVPQMRKMLEERAFEVDVAELGGSGRSGWPDLAPYRGVVLGCPVSGPGLDGLRGRPPELPEAFARFVAEAPGLEEKRVALFTVYTALPGQLLLQMRAAVEARGAQVVVAHPYWRLRPERGEHVLPAECMVRIRR